MIVDLRAKAIGGVVLDIEGTTTPVTFVYEELFPYARRHLRAFLTKHWNAHGVRAAVERLHAEWLRDREHSENPPAWTGAADSLAAYLEWLMDRDRKSTGLKLLQGYVWEEGYRSGALTSQMYDDVAPALRRWHTAGLTIAIYSSGSALAQRLLFGHGPDGDLTGHLGFFFDTTVGPKTDARSYRAIAGAVSRPPDRLLFISDTPGEIEAAAAAGFNVLLCVRPGSSTAPGAHFQTISSFDDVIVG